MHDLSTLKDINEQEAATRALNAIRKSAEPNRCKSGACGGGYKPMTPEEAAEIVKKFHAADPK